MRRRLIYLFLAIFFVVSEAAIANNSVDILGVEGGEWPFPYKEAPFPIDTIEGFWKVGVDKPYVKLEYVAKVQSGRRNYHLINVKLVDRGSYKIIGSGLGRLTNSTLSSTVYLKDQDEPFDLKVKSFYPKTLNNWQTRRSQIMYIVRTEYDEDSQNYFQMHRVSPYEARGILADMHKSIK